jgi:kynureninase
MLAVDDLRRSPNALAADYRHSRVDARILLTGHSHQASPDCSLQGQSEAWLMAARNIEARWDDALEKAAQVRAGFAQLIDCAPDCIALAGSVHDLVVRFLSALPRDTTRRRIVTTDGEHPSVNRQLYRAAEDGFEVVTVPVEPVDSVVARVQQQIDDRTSAVFISSVFFETGQIALELDTLMPVCQRHGAQLFVDAYQSVNVLPFSLRESNLGQAFVVGGGTKYCQLGDGIAFMHVPEGCSLRPWVTGWFGTFDALADNPAGTPIAYGDNHQRFDGSGYDPTAHYRAVHVFDYFRRKGLTPEFLHDVNRHQVGYLASLFAGFDFDPGLIRLANSVDHLGGFVSFITPHARQLCETLRDIGIHTDYRRNWLRMGPAPYLCDEQLADAMGGLEEALRLLQARR